MNKSFILDFKFLQEQGLSINEFITLLKLYDDTIDSRILDIRANTLQQKGFIKIIQEEDKVEYIIREKGRLLLELITINESISNSKSKPLMKKSNRVVVNEVDEFIEEFRNLWKGLKPGSLGSLQGCKEKMSRWIKNNPGYTKQDILKAARTYIKSVDNLRYLQQADYFIYKKDGLGEGSKLSAFIDEEEQIEEGWTSKIV